MTLAVMLIGALMTALLVSIVASALAAVRASELTLRERYLHANPPIQASDSPRMSPCIGS